MAAERSIFIPSPTPLARVIDSVGTDLFGQQLMAYVNAEARVDYCSAYRIGPQSLSAVSLSSPDERSCIEHVWTYVYGQFWKKDPSLNDARSLVSSTGQAAVRMSGGDDIDTDLRRFVYPELVDRLLICSVQQDATYGVSLLRWQPSPRYTDEEVGRLTSIGSLVLALIGRHSQALSLRRSPADALGALVEAEQCFADLTSLPIREREVCARTVFGLSAGEIAAALRISAETVKSYRKRAYGRLNVGSERELLMRYLQLWDEWQVDAPRSDSAPSPREMTCLPRSAKVLAV